MTNVIKTRNAAPAPFESVLDQLFPKNVTAVIDDALWGLGSAAIGDGADQYGRNSPGGLSDAISNSQKPLIGTGAIRQRRPVPPIAQEPIGREGRSYLFRPLV